MEYKRYSLYEYVPVRFKATREEQAVRDILYRFKDTGILDTLTKVRVADKINSLMMDDPGDWFVCFIPAQNAFDTVLRYSELASFLRENVACEVSLDAIYNVYIDDEDDEKKKNPLAAIRFNFSNFYRRKVILIDDIVVEGIFFEAAAKLIEHAGAASVCGLFIAETSDDQERELHWKTEP